MYAAKVMTKGRDFHLVNISEARKMTVRELVQRIADHEKAYVDQLKADARKREKWHGCDGRHGPIG